MEQGGGFNRLSMTGKLNPRRSQNREERGSEMIMVNDRQRRWWTIHNLRHMKIMGAADWQIAQLVANKWGRQATSHDWVRVHHYSSRFICQRWICCSVRQTECDVCITKNGRRTNSVRSPQESISDVWLGAFLMLTTVFSGLQLFYQWTQAGI